MLELIPPPPAPPPPRPILAVEEEVEGMGWCGERVVEEAVATMTAEEGELCTSSISLRSSQKETQPSRLRDWK
jgi:hypothetical protein